MQPVTKYKHSTCSDVTSGQSEPVIAFVLDHRPDLEVLLLPIILLVDSPTLPLSIRDLDRKFLALDRTARDRARRTAPCSVSLTSSPQFETIVAAIGRGRRHVFDCKLVPDVAPEDDARTDRDVESSGDQFGNLDATVFEFVGQRAGICRINLVEKKY